MCVTGELILMGSQNRFSQDIKQPFYILLLLSYHLEQNKCRLSYSVFYFIILDILFISKASKNLEK